jgi:hypothetical protein
VSETSAAPVLKSHSVRCEPLASTCGCSGPKQTRDELNHPLRPEKNLARREPSSGCSLILWFILTCVIPAFGTESIDISSRRRNWGEDNDLMAERVGFETLNAGPKCTGLHGLVQAQKTQHLQELRLPPDFIDAFSKLIHTEYVAQ